MLIDLHCHSAERSEDASSSLAELAAAARAAGLDGVCVTDHDGFWPREALEEIGRAAGILLIPGCEVNTDSGHALVFGPDEYRFGFHHPERLAAAVEAAGGALVAAHPYRRVLPPDASPGDETFGVALDRALESPLLKHAAAIETLNGRGAARENAFALELASRARLPCVGSSDAHDASGVGSVATSFERPVGSLKELVAELRAGRVRPWTSDPSVPAG
jgi:predicted metal-dependent phosphoesterase TrpH